MSGFEVVGVVLATVPIIISALQGYANGVRTIRRMWDYRRELEMLITTLETEDMLFRNTCEHLLDGVAGVGAGEMEELLTNPGGPLWKQGDLGRRIEQRLSKSYPIFFKRVEDMEHALEEFRGRLGLDSDGKMQWTDKSALRKALKGRRLVLTMENFKDLFDRIKEDNRTLKEFTNQSIQLELSRRGRSQATKLNYLRSSALDIYRVLIAAFKCGCQHQIGLSLSSATEASGQRLVHEGHRPCQVLISGLSEQSPHDWQQIQLNAVAITQNILPVIPSTIDTTAGAGRSKARRIGFADEMLSRASENQLHIAQHLVLNSLSYAPITACSNKNQRSLSTPTTEEVSEEILDLCSRLRLRSTSKLSDALGIISDRSNRFMILPIDPEPNGSPARSTISLAQILNGKGSSGLSPPFRERLRIAVTVSSAVLELHQTPWMQSEPSKTNILFFAETRRLHTTAFVATALTQTPAQPYLDNNDLLPPYIENKALFFLGILLIEILFGTPIEEIRVEKYPNLQTSKVELETKYLIAAKLLDDDEEVNEQGGFKYESAVRSCIKCNFEKFRKMDLNDDAFRQTVHERVVALLEDTSVALDL